MSHNNWEEIEQIIDQVLDLPKKERKQFIDTRCEGKPELKGEVTQLLESIFDSEGWLENPEDYKRNVYEEISDDVQLLSTQDSLVGTQVGSYQIVEQIGKGGMGTVYLAEHVSEKIDHQVAIKIIQTAKATEQNLLRFKREQQILAGLHHPSIARLYDAGTTEDGFPYIIMEYVNGIPVDSYCKKHNCSIDQKLKIFVDILEAVRYAHENLVIHRDLKPDNIFIDKTGSVKILDFGISKLIEDDNNLSLTRTGTRLLTPRYAAPEQIKQKNITTATDLYSLGVIFYELLAEAPPFDLSDCTAYEAEQVILTKQPEKPSNKAPSKQKSHTIRGDLNAIALKAIRKEPDRRYRVATEFLEDLNHYLKGLPVSARTNSFQYRASKFIARHKKSMAVTAVVLVLIVGLSGYYTLRISEQRDQAQIEAQKAQNISDFLLTLFEANFPENARGESLTAEQLLQEGRQKADQIRDIDMRANMLSVIGKAYSKLGYRDSALSILNKAKILIGSSHGHKSLEYAAINFSIGNAHDVYSDLALPYFQRSFNIRSKILGNDHPKTVESLLEIGITKNNLGQTDSARYYLEQANQIIKNSPTLYPSLQTKINEQRANLYSHSGNNEKAKQLYQKLLSGAENDIKTDSLTISRWKQNLAWTYIRQQQFQEAKPYLKSALSITESILGKGHQTTLKVRNDLAGVNKDIGNMERFQQLSEENVKYTIEHYGNDHKMACQASSSYGLNLTFSKHFDKGEQYLRDGLEICSRALGENHTWTAFAKVCLAANLEFNNKIEASSLYFEEGFKVLKKKSANFNRVNERQISIILNLYKKITPSNKDKIESFNSLLNR